MSELQNRIIRQLQTRSKDREAHVLYDRKQQLLIAALNLFHAAGGSVTEIQEVAKCYQPIYNDVAEAVAAMMVETAALSHASDLDMIQAAYNWIDNTPA